MNTKLAIPQILKKHSQIILYSMVLTLSFSMVLIPEFAEKIRNTLYPDYRKVVGTVSADLAKNGSLFKFIKIKTKENLFVEIYNITREGTTSLVDKIKLEDRYDGFVNFNGVMTNIALDDVTGSGKLDLLVPSYDRDMVAHLNVYTYSPSDNTFARMTR